ncbi:hypothetical protein ES708_31008 [subsurface metagenome]
MGEKYKSRLMFNYEVRNVETGSADDCIGFEYQVVF